MSLYHIIIGPNIQRIINKNSSKVWTYMYMLVDSLTIDQLTDTFY